MTITQETKQSIANTTGPVKQIAEQFGVSVSSVYNYRNRYADPPAPNAPMNASRTRFDQLAKSGLQRSGGQIYEEFQRELQDDGGVGLFTEMATHPVASAVLFAIQMAQRKVAWFVEPASEDDADVEAAEFLEQVRDDMSQTWDDIISQVYTMLKYGYSAAEIVYKKRLGHDPPKYVDDPAGSRFDDGKIGWRRWQFMSPRTMAPGGRWTFDDQGRVLSLTQQPPPSYYDITVPIEKLLLFRTRIEWDNPEGYSILRSMYQPWYYAQNLAEIEAITAERMGAGFPVMYLGDGTTKGGNNNDLTAAENYVTNIRADEQAGLALPYPKLGTAGEGRGVLFEFVSPPGKGAVDFNQVIERYERRMAMVVLAQFIFLGMSSTGTQALAGTVVDVFQEAIAAWSTMTADVINRFAVPRLFALNPYNVEALPQFKHSEASVPNLAEIATYVNALVGAQVITPDESLEKHLRAMADLPEKPEEAIEIVAPGEVEPEPVEDEPDDEVELEEGDEEASEHFGLKTIKGALARNEQGKFERGSGPPVSDKDVASADALLNGRMTPAQAAQFEAAGLLGERDGKKYLTPEGRNITRMMASNPRAAVARMRTALGKAKPMRAKTPSVKPGEKRPGVKVAAKGGGGKGKGKAKKKGGGGGGGGGGAAKPKEKAKLNTEQQERLDTLLESGMPEDVAVAMSLIYDSGSPNAIARAQDAELAGKLQELGLLGENDQGNATVSEDGRRLMDAVKNGDIDTVSEMLEGLFNEEFATRSKPGNPKWERETSAYEQRLRSEYATWANATTKELVNIDDDAEFNDYLDDAVIALVMTLIRLGRERLPRAQALGLAGVPATPEGIQQMASVIASNDELLENSLGPAVRDKVLARINDDELIRRDADSLKGVFQTFLGRVGSYAGPFWGLIGWGMVDRIKQMVGKPRIKVVLDVRAKHCKECPEYEGIYENIDEMIAATGGVPARWNSSCGCNCRCTYFYEKSPDVWTRM